MNEFGLGDGFYSSSDEESWLVGTDEDDDKNNLKEQMDKNGKRELASKSMMKRSKNRN